MAGFSGWQLDGGGGGGVRTSTGTPGPVGKNDEAERKACEKGVSWELRDACELPDVPGTDPSLDIPQRKVGTWLAKHSSKIVAAEHQWGVDRRAIAGAIAFEALQDVQSNFRHTISQRSFGPGKIHVVNWYSTFYEFMTTVEQTEFAGYLKWVKITRNNLRDNLAAADGSITCIAAVMRADADAAHLIGGYSEKETYWNPPVLAAWFQGKTLFALVEIYAKKDFNHTKHPLDPGEIKMGVWVRDHLSYLTAFVGQSDTTVPITPIPGAKDLRKAADEYWALFVEVERAKTMVP